MSMLLRGAPRSDHLCALLATCLAISGCATIRSGTFDSAGFRHLHLEYRVDHDAAGSLAGDWIIDNYRPDLQQLKSGVDNVRPLQRDLDGDGTLEDLGPHPVDDLRFRSRQAAGVMWIRSIPLPEALSGTELRVLARMLVDSVTGVGLQFIEIRTGALQAVQRRYATRDVQTHPGVIDGREAFQVRFEVASVDQAQAGGDARWERVHLMLIRTNLSALYNYTQSLPVVMVAGYRNLPDDFERDAPAFHSLLSRIRFETAATWALRERVLACDPDRDVIPFAVIAPTGWVTMPPGLAGMSGCVQQAMSGIDLGRIEAWRSFAIQRTPFVPRATP